MSHTNHIRTSSATQKLHNKLGITQNDLYLAPQHLFRQNYT